MSRADLHQRLQELAKHEIIDRHSFFQLKYFLVGKEPTIQSKMWRCLIELNSRKESMAAITLEIEDTYDKLELLNLEIKHSNRFAFFKKKRLKNKIRIRQLERQKKATSDTLKTLEKKQKNATEEAEFLLGAFESLEKIEQLKPYDDYDSQMEYWNAKFLNELNLELLLRKPIDTELVKSILALDNKAEVKTVTLQMLKSIEEQSLISKEESRRIDGK